jgi:hypothetical protein
MTEERKNHDKLEALAETGGSAAYFFAVKNQQLKNVLCWLGVVLCRRENDEYRCTCVGCGLVCAVGAGSGRPGALAIYSFFVFLKVFGDC